MAAGQRVIAGVYHIQNINAFDSRLKTGCVASMGLPPGISIPTSVGSESSTGRQQPA